MIPRLLSMWWGASVFGLPLWDVRVADYLACRAEHAAWKVPSGSRYAVGRLVLIDGRLSIAEVTISRRMPIWSSSAVAQEEAIRGEGSNVG